MTAAAVTAGIVAVVGLLVWLGIRYAGRSATAEAERDQKQGVLDDVAKANAARDRLRRNPAYRERVRDRFRG